MPLSAPAHTFPLAMADRTPENGGGDEAVRFASAVTVKRTKSVSPFAKGAYGEGGVLALTDTSLIFIRGGAIDWRISRDQLANVKKPWYGIGSYVTFDVDGAFYGLAFGRGMVTAPASAGAAAIVVDALVAARLHGAVKLGGRWFELLRGRS